MRCWQMAWRSAAGWSNDQQEQRPNGRATGTERLAPRHRSPPNGGIAPGVAACVRGRSGASVPFAGIATRFQQIGFSPEIEEVLK